MYIKKCDWQISFHAFGPAAGEIIVQLTKTIEWVLVSKTLNLFQSDAYTQ